MSTKIQLIVLSIILVLLTVYITFAIIATESKYIFGVLGFYKFASIDPEMELSGNLICRLPLFIMIFFIAKRLKKLQVNYLLILSISILIPSIAMLIISIGAGVSDYFSEFIFSLIFILVSAILIFIGQKKRKFKKENPPPIDNNINNERTIS